MADRPAPPDLMSPEFITDPYPIYRVCWDEYPLIWHETMDADVISEGLFSPAPGALLLEFVPTSQTFSAVPGSGAPRG